MLESIKTSLQKTPGIQFVWNLASLLYEKYAYAIWRLRGKPTGDGFSFHKRHRLIREGKRYGCKTLVESGTYLGGTVKAARPHFQQILSVELSPVLYQKAVKRFYNAHNVKLWQGDSGMLMKEMVKHIDGRAIFWLDGHYSAGITARGASDCPIVAELSAIGSHARNDHIILIDDARLFGSHPEYPKQEDVRRLLLSINPKYGITIEEDCITARLE